MAYGINLLVYRAVFPLPVVPQANGREQVLEVGELFWSLKAFFLPATFSPVGTVYAFSSCLQQARTSPVNPAQASHGAGHVPFWDI